MRYYAIVGYEYDRNWDFTAEEIHENEAGADRFRSAPEICTFSPQSCRLAWLGV